MLWLENDEEDLKDPYTGARTPEGGNLKEMLLNSGFIIDYKTFLSTEKLISLSVRGFYFKWNFRTSYWTWDFIKIITSWPSFLASTKHLTFLKQNILRTVPNDRAKQVTYGVEWALSRLGTADRSGSLCHPEVRKRGSDCGDSTVINHLKEF